MVFTWVLCSICPFLWNLEEGILIWVPSLAESREGTVSRCYHCTVLSPVIDMFCLVCYGMIAMFWFSFSSETTSLVCAHRCGRVLYGPATVPEWQVWQRARLVRVPLRRRLPGAGAAGWRGQPAQLPGRGRVLGRLLRLRHQRSLHQHTGTCRGRVLPPRAFSRDPCTYIYSVINATNFTETLQVWSIFWTLMF